MKTNYEIQRAHDLLLGIVLGEVPSPFTGKASEIDAKAIADRIKSESPQIWILVRQLQLKSSADVLCWLLEHDHNKAFSENLAATEAWLRERNFILEDKRN